MSDGPAAVIVDGDGTEVLVKDTDTIAPSTQPVVPVGGVDGTTLRTIRVDSAGRQKMQADALPLPAGASTEAKLEAVRVLLASIDGKDFSTQTTLALQAADIAALLVNSADIETILTGIRDTAGIKKITDELPAGTQEIGSVKQGTKAALAGAWPVVATDADGNAISSQLDAGVRRIEIAGKVSITGASPPPNTTAAIIRADNPLTVGANDTAFTIPDGETFFLQELVSGNEDPTKGAVVDVIYDNGTEHLIARQYVAGVTQAINGMEDGMARDGTACIGNAGGTFTVIVRRTKYSGSDIAIDAEARGYTA